MRSSKLDLAPGPEVCGHADGWNQLTAGRARVSCTVGVLVAKQKSTIASGGKDAFPRCVSAMSLCSLHHHSLRELGRRTVDSENERKTPKISWMLAPLALMTLQISVCGEW